MGYETIVVEQDGPLAILRFNRPQQYNAVNPLMAEEIADAVVGVGNNADARALMITGEGGAFSSGGDIKFFRSPAFTPNVIERMVADLHAYISRLIRLPKPVIAAVNGPAAGAGFSLAMVCDLVVVHPEAVFTMGYTKIGASPDGGSTFCLGRLLGVRRALELTLTNRVLTAEEAVEWGLATRVLSGEKFFEEAKGFAMELANGPTLAFGRSKELLYHSVNHQLETQLELEARGIINSMRTADFDEGTGAFVEKRTPTFGGK